MPLYMVRRELGKPTAAELDAAAYRAVMCAFEFEGLRWVRSFWDAETGEMHCVYEAVDAGQIRDHSQRSRIPCDDVRPIAEVLPDRFESASVLQGEEQQA